MPYKKILAEGQPAVSYLAKISDATGQPVCELHIEPLLMQAGQVFHQLVFCPQKRNAGWAGSYLHYGPPQESAEMCAAQLAPQARHGEAWQEMLEILPGLELPDGIADLYSPFSPWEAKTSVARR